MKKTFYSIISLLIFIQQSSFAQQITSSWGFVGPISENRQFGNYFKTAQIDAIAADPSDANHIVVSGFFSGLWQSFNAAHDDWTNMNIGNIPTGIGCNGISAVAFRNNNELYAGNWFCYPKGNNPYSNGVFKYTYSTNSWQTLGAIPSGGQNYVINRIVFYPGNNNIVFLCTSIGLFQSTNAGSTWTQVSSATGNIYNMVFIQQSNGTDYYCYISGSTIASAGGVYQGTALLMEANMISGALGSFSNVNEFMTLLQNQSYPNQLSYSSFCLGNQSLGNNDREIYLYTAITSTTGSWTSGATHWTYKFVKNLNSGSKIVTQLVQIIATNTPPGNTDCNPGRLTIGYDQLNNMLLCGYVSLFSINLSDLSKYHSTPNDDPPYVHRDVHDIYINNTNNQVFVACDGGFYSGTLVLAQGTTPQHYNFEIMNSHLDITLINGFAGASENTNIYVISQQDHLVTDYYDADLLKTTAQHWSGENDGALIDKFNNNLIISDRASYDDLYYVTAGDPSSFSSAFQRANFLPSTSPTYYLEPGNTVSASQNFGQHPFFQDPYRAGRIFNSAKGACIFQLDPVSQKFVGKFRLQEEFTFFTNSPTLKSEACPNCTANPNDPLHRITWQEQPTGMAFSPQDKNTVYITTSNDPLNTPKGASQVVKYIGPDFDDIWFGHNEIQDASNNPQWQLITPTWSTLVPGITDANVFHINLNSIESSAWDRNKLYVTCNSDLPSSTFNIKVIKYDGTNWTDYSTGIPPEEVATAMIMDHASYDGIYLSTNKGIYYRDASMSSWVPYMNNEMPILLSNQLEINYKENTVRAGTYGRGIWKSPLVCPNPGPLNFANVSPVVKVHESDYITATNTTIAINVGKPTVFRATNSVTLNPGFLATVGVAYSGFQAFIHGCNGGSTSGYQYYRTMADPEVKNMFEAMEDAKKITVYPNPSNGAFTLILDPVKPGEKSEEEVEREAEVETEGEISMMKVSIYNMLGDVVYQTNAVPSNTKQLPVNMENQKNGIYIIKVEKNGKIKTCKFIKQ